MPFCTADMSRSGPGVGDRTRPLPRALGVELRLQRPGLDIRAQFRVPPGRVCALVGRSGSGKTSLLMAAAGLLDPLGGRVALGPDTLYDATSGVNLPPRARRLSWLDGQLHLFPHLTVKNNLLYGHRVGGGGKGPRLEEITRWLAIEPLLHRRAGTLGAPDAVRVALGRALLAHPNALLLDDPLARVSAEDRAPLIQVVAEIPTRLSLPMVLVSPRMDEVTALADEVVVLHEGRMASAGPTSHILSDVSLSTFLEGEQAGSVLEGTVKRHDVSWLLSEVDVAGQRVTVPATLYPVGSRVRLKVRARDVALHRNVPSDTSVSNHLRGRVTQIMLAGEHGTYGAVVVELDRAVDPGGQGSGPPVTLWALLTRKSIQQMGWAPGQPCVLGVKSMAINVFPWR